MSHALLKQFIKETDKARFQFEHEGLLKSFILEEAEYFKVIAGRTASELFDNIQQAFEMLVYDQTYSNHSSADKTYTLPLRHATVPRKNWSDETFADYFPGFTLIGVDKGRDAFYMVHHTDENAGVYEWREHYDKALDIYGPSVFKITEDMGRFIEWLKTPRENQQQPRTTLADLHAGADQQYQNKTYKVLPLVPVRIDDGSDLFNNLMDLYPIVSVPGGLGSWIDEASEFGPDFEMMAPLFVVPAERDDINDIAYCDAGCEPEPLLYAVNIEHDMQPVSQWTYEDGFIQVSVSLDDFLAALKEYDPARLDELRR